MLASLEVLAHFQCPDCKEAKDHDCWFTIADMKIKRGDSVTCPRCSQPFTITEIQNGKGKNVTGVFWKYTKTPDQKHSKEA